ncbi:MAG: hypothetical protein MUP03_08430 [Anaerolineales bacterium]|nr:hypothetical protein [Anaerolineales bacterium]
MFYKRAFKVLLVSIVVFTISTVAYAFAAANTVGDSQAGDGEGAISGYDVTDIEYTLDASDPSMIGSVDFTTNAVAGVASVSFDDGTSWYDCTSAGGTDWSCDLASGAVDVLLAVELRVVAAQ